MVSADIYFGLQQLKTLFWWKSELGDDLFIFQDKTRNTKLVVRIQADIYLRRCLQIDFDNDS